MSRTTTLVFDVLPISRSPDQKAVAVLDLIQDALVSRTGALREEAKKISGAVSQICEGKRPIVRSARWYRTCSQLDILQPLDVELRSIVESKVCIEERLRKVTRTIEEEIRALMVRLSNQAQTIALDMDALAMRVQAQGHLAELCDFRSAQWYSTVSQIQALKLIYSAVCEIVQIDEVAIIPPADSDNDEDCTETDSASAD